MAIRTRSEKSKLKSNRSWEKNRLAKIVRIEEQTKREERNRELGSTGKQRANQAAKEAKRTALTDPENVHLEEVKE